MTVNHCNAVGCGDNSDGVCQAKSITLQVSSKVSRAWGKAGEIAPLDCYHFNTKKE